MYPAIFTKMAKLSTIIATSFIPRFLRDIIEIEREARVRLLFFFEGRVRLLTGLRIERFIIQFIITFIVRFIIVIVIIIWFG